MHFSELKTRKDEHTALQLAYTQLQKNYDRVVVECEHVTSELLKAKEQMTELANSEAAMAQKLADIQKQHEIDRWQHLCRNLQGVCDLIPFCLVQITLDVFILEGKVREEDIVF